MSVFQTHRNSEFPFKKYVEHMYDVYDYNHHNDAITYLPAVFRLRRNYFLNLNKLTTKTLTRILEKT